MKDFSRDRKPAERKPFKFPFLRDGEQEVHVFTAVLQMDAAVLSRTMNASRRDQADTLPQMFNAIAKHLDNKDGVPAHWEPVPHRSDAPKRPAIVDPVTVTWPGVEQLGMASHGAHVQGDLTVTGPGVVSEPEREEVSQDAVFRAPYGPEKGQLLRWHRSEEFLKFESGSSRRRWLYLIEQDDELIVDAEDVAKAFEWMIEEAANRPT